MTQPRKSRTGEDGGGRRRSEEVTFSIFLRLSPPFSDLLAASIPMANRSLPQPASFAGRPLLRSAREAGGLGRSEEHTSELQSQSNLVCRLLLGKKKNIEPQQVQLALEQQP